MQPCVCSSLGDLQLGDSLSEILAVVSRSLFWAHPVFSWACIHSQFLLCRMLRCPMAPAPVQGCSCLLLLSPGICILCSQHTISSSSSFSSPPVSLSSSTSRVALFLCQLFWSRYFKVSPQWCGWRRELCSSSGVAVGFEGFLFIGVSVVPGKGAALVGVQMKPGDKWRCQGEHEAVKVVIGSKIAEGKSFSCRPSTACRVSFGSFWRQIKLTSGEFLWLIADSLLWLFLVQREWGEIRCCFLNTLVLFLLISLPPFSSPLCFGHRSV